MLFKKNKIMKKTAIQFLSIVFICAGISACNSETLDRADVTDRDLYQEGADTNTNRNNIQDER